MILRYSQNLSSTSKQKTVLSSMARYMQQNRCSLVPVSNTNICYCKQRSVADLSSLVAKGLFFVDVRATPAFKWGVVYPLGASVSSRFHLPHRIMLMLLQAWWLQGAKPLQGTRPVDNVASFLYLMSTLKNFHSRRNYWNNFRQWTKSVEWSFSFETKWQADAWLINEFHAIYEPGN
jgi:hypothetical protein